MLCLRKLKFKHLWATTVPNSRTCGSGAMIGVPGHTACKQGLIIPIATHLKPTHTHKKKWISGGISGLIKQPSHLQPRDRLLTQNPSPSWPAENGRSRSSASEKPPGHRQCMDNTYCSHTHTHIYIYIIHMYMYICIACMHAWYTKLTKHFIQTCLQGTIPRDSSKMFQDLRLWWVLGCPPVGTWFLLWMDKRSCTGNY